MEAIHVRKTIYLPAPFVGILLEHYLTPVEAWSRLCGAIVNTGSTVDCNPITNWLRVALTMRSGIDHPSPLAMSRTAAPRPRSYGDKPNLPPLSVPSGGAHIDPARVEDARGLAQDPKAHDTSARI